jgi:nitrogen regulatory protein PII
MKQVIAIVKPFLAERVVLAVSEFPLIEMVVREVKGYGRQKSYLDRYGENEFSGVFVAKVEVSMMLDDEHVERAVDAINRVSRTGRLGDGKILVLPVIQAIEAVNPPG